MKARLRGSCKLCGRLYKAGTEIVRYGSVRPWVHEKCAASREVVPENKEVTMTTSHGECPGEFTLCTCCGGFCQGCDDPEWKSRSRGR